MVELKLPELGEDIETVEVATVLVAVGDLVRRDQPVIEVETEKASLEVPATSDGRVSELLVGRGDAVRVGQVILRLDDADGSGQAAAQAGAEAASATAGDAASFDGAAESDASGAVVRSEIAAAEVAVISFRATGPATRPESIGATVPAAPSARALARQLGIDITEVRGSGRGGRINRDDVKAHAKALIRGHGQSAAPPAQQLPDFTQWGEVERRPLDNIRRATARAMAAAWSTVPHVTQFDHADITQLESMRKRFNQRPEAADRKLSMTAIVIKMVASVLRQMPKLNASLDLAGDAVIFKKFIHIGVAVDTERGLLVPVIRDVDRKSLVQVTTELTELAARARDKKLRPDEMRGASFTVSNLGGLGTTYFSPIVSWPEVAILGVGRAELQAVHEDGRFQPRLILPLSLSYDHRLVDGADAARALRRLAEALEQPLLLLLDE